MKKIVLSTLLLLFITYVTHGQQTDPIVKYLLKRGYTFPDSILAHPIPDSLKQWPDTLYYNMAYKPKFMRTATIPISFSKVEFIPAQTVNGQYQAGHYEVVPVVSLGFGYNWFLGDFIFSNDDKIMVDPSVYFGVIADAGLQSNFSINELSLNPYRFLGSIFAGGFIGVSTFSLFVGWDFISHGPSIGIGGRIDLYNINQKYLKPVGKIKAARRHKGKNVTPRITED
jgi:hypothetical protein